MKNALMMGAWRYLLGVPPALWQRQVKQSRAKILAGMAFMSPLHRRVHHHVVATLPRQGGPLPPSRIARDLELKTDQVVAILADLEEHMTFLFRDPQGAVIWAYPVTVEKTPHRLTFSSGERLFGA